ncbi:MAG TPA: biotin-dependent carboxyltransferase family protein [Pseudonocardia sp.]
MSTGAFLEVLAAGPGATVQDLGRNGYGELGVGRSGAADRPALRLANRLVGNTEQHAGLEITFGGLGVRFTRTSLVAVTGALGPLTAGGRAEGTCAPFHVRAGEELIVGTPVQGMRSYLAVRGGVAVTPVLGSRSTDTLAGLGPPPLEPGAVLPVGATALGYPNVDLAPRPAHPGRPELRVIPGPREDWFVPDALDRLCGTGGYRVSAESDRVGMRLDGPVLERRGPGELPPEACVPGALQVPPFGQPILFLADHPVTGGYPVIGVVHPDDLPLAAQTRPGQYIRFRPVRRLPGPAR